MSTEDKIQKLTESLLKLSSSLELSDAIDSDFDENSRIAASPKAVSTLSSVILDAVKNAVEGSDGENEIYEPLLAEVRHEIGSWWFSIDGSVPAGGLPHLGHLVSRSAYGTGWNWIETNKIVVSDEEWLAYASEHNGTCPYYSYGDGSTTFRTPSYDQSFLKVLTSITETGNVEEAGLPNITGGVTIRDMSTGDSTFPGIWGAFSQENRTESYTTSINQDSTDQIGKIVNFDASLSKPIYGNSDTVTPQNYGIIVGIYLVGAVSSPIGETDAAGLLNGLSALETTISALETTKASINANNFSSEGKNFLAGLGMPSDRYVDLTLGASNTAYTMPANGFLFISKAADTSNQYVIFYNNTKDYGNISTIPTSSWYARLLFPVCKNDSVSVRYTTAGELQSFRFIYAEGAE